MGEIFTIKSTLEKYNIKSILGVIPNCEDRFIEVGKINSNYFENLREYASYGDLIAQHGYKHLYDSRAKGFYGNSFNSEFAGHPYKIQLNKLLKGKEILQRESLWKPVLWHPTTFLIPSH